MTEPEIKEEGTQVNAQEVVPAEANVRVPFINFLFFLHRLLADRFGFLTNTIELCRLKIQFQTSLISLKDVR